jgi:hypothetical protein
MIIHLQISKSLYDKFMSNRLKKLMRVLMLEGMQPLGAPVKKHNPSKGVAAVWFLMSVAYAVGAIFSESRRTLLIWYAVLYFALGVVYVVFILKPWRKD